MVNITSSLGIFLYDTISCRKIVSAGCCARRIFGQNTTAFNYFKENGGGQLAVISSIAGTKGLGAAPAYSATKRFQNIYIDTLDQLARMEKLPIIFTDIRPGFVKTDLLKNDKYPMLMSPSYTAEQIVKAISRKKRRAIIDWKYAILVFFWKLIPDWIWVRLPIRN